MPTLYDSDTVVETLNAYFGEGEWEGTVGPLVVVLRRSNKVYKITFGNTGGSISGPDGYLEIVDDTDALTKELKKLFPKLVCRKGPVTPTVDLSNGAQVREVLNGYFGTGGWTGKDFEFECGVFQFIKNNEVYSITFDVRGTYMHGPRFDGAYLRTTTDLKTALERLFKLPEKTDVSGGTTGLRLTTAISRLEALLRQT